jgi:hypothetical protein
MNTASMQAIVNNLPSATTQWSGITSQHQGQLYAPISGQNMIGPNLGQGIIYPSIGASVVSGGFGAATTYHSLQSAYMFYKWNLGYEFPTELMEAGEPLVPALYITNQCAMMLHISVWVEICKPNINDFGVVWDGQFSNLSSTSTGIKKEAEGVLMIKQGKTLDQFRIWWPDYTSRFDGDDWKTQQLPLIKEGMEITGSALAHGEIISYTGLQFMATDKLFDRWCWIVERTHQPVWFNNDFWFFNNSAEMLMYKLIDEK